MVPLERRLEKVLYGFSYAVTDQTLKINTEKKVISLNLQIDTDICSMYEYFEIFLQRMLMCRGAADMLGATFKLTANGAKVLKEQEPAFTIKNKKSRLKVKLSLSGGMSFNMTAMAACVIMNSARCQVLDNFFQIQIFNDGGFIVCSNCASDPCSATTPSLSTTILPALETVRIRWAMMRTVLFFYQPGYSRLLFY